MTKVAVVTGSSSGIGREISLTLARNGFLTYATMRNLNKKENIKCKKSNCYHKEHGPYYYAYWKDPITKKLKKKYIGRHYYPVHEQENREDT